MTGSNLHIPFGWNEKKEKRKIDTGCVSFPFSLFPPELNRLPPLPPFPLSIPLSLPLIPSYSLGQECFNFRDRFCLSSGAGWPVVQTMRCDGCKTIKKKEREQEMGENKEEKSSLYWTDLITLNRD